MVVGICRIVLSLRGVSSLKEKRSVVRRVVDRTRSRFNASVAEVADMDAHQRAVIGFAVVSNSGRHAHEMMDKLVSFIDSASDVPVVERKSERVWQLTRPPKVRMEFQDARLTVVLEALARQGRAPGGAAQEEPAAA